MNKKILGFASVLAAGSALAEGESTPVYETAVSQLQTLGTSAASSIGPMVVAVGVAFAGLALAMVAIRWFRRSAK